jgi:recombination DNA repair RAD52 pathway protein
MTQDLTVEQLERLHNDLHPARVARRTGGGGNALSYLEAYDVKATLIRIFGYAQFSVEVIDYKITYQDTYMTTGDNPRELWRVAATATVKLTIHQTGAVYMETAAASQSGPDIGEVTDFAVKSAESDALKRCAIYLGTTFGLSLYNNGSTGDVVRKVFAPGQMDVIEDLNAVRAAAPDAAQAMSRLQARLKTTTAPAPDHEPPAEPDVEPASDPLTEPVSPANDPLPEPAEPAAEPVVDKVAKAKDDLQRITTARARRAPAKVDA